MKSHVNRWTKFPNIPMLDDESRLAAAAEMLARIATRAVEEGRLEVSWPDDPTPETEGC